jgi:hypothetical protein
MPSKTASPKIEVQLRSLHTNADRLQSAPDSVKCLLSTAPCYEYVTLSVSLSFQVSVPVASPLLRLHVSTKEIYIHNEWQKRARD